VLYNVAMKLIDEQMQSALAWLKKRGSKAARNGMARYAIPSDHAYGVSVKFS